MTKTKNSLVVGLLLMCCSCIVINEAARRYTRRPNESNSIMNPPSSPSPPGRRRTDTADTAASKLNTGSLSDTILGNNNNRNGRGNPTSRQFRPLPPQPREVNYTAQDIANRFPWIPDPQSVVFRTSSFSRSSSWSSNSSRSRSGRPWTRFNNPQYLRDILEGLNLDNYAFRVTQGVPAANGRYKVRVNQDWRKLPIYGLSMVMEQENDTNLILETADGIFISGIEDDIASETPAISEQAAIQRALDYNRDMGKRIETPNAELIVDTVGDTAILAYLINYFVPVEAPEPSSTAAPPSTTAIPTTTAAPTTPPLDPVMTTQSFSIWRGWRRNRRRRFGNGRRGRARRRGKRRLPRSPTFGPTIPAGVETEPPTNSQTIPTLPPSFKMSVEGNKRPWLLMNANTGEIYKTWEGLTAFTRPVIRPARVPILTGNPVYSEKNYTEIMYRDLDTGFCYYQKPLGGGKFLRVNDKTSSNTANVYKFRCNDAVEFNYDRTNGAASTRNNAYKWGSEAINYLRRISNFRWNFHLNIEAHHSGIHAVWNGREVQLGDGDPVLFYPLTTPDTVVHEVTHAFTEHVSRLEYRSQSGAMNEAYSDMAASAFLDYFFRLPAKEVYQIGRMSLKFDTALRDLCDPGNTKLLLYNPQKPVITSALDYTASTDLHNASSLYSKAFCELSKTPGWNIQQAFRVFTNANVIYWTPRETFNSGACGVKKAAHDLKNTAQAVRDVDRAFQFVNIACNSNDWINLVAAV